MITHPLYVFMHIPKTDLTGGDYTRQILKKYFGGKEDRGKHRKHTVLKNVDKHKKKQQAIIGLLRDPKDWYVSLFYWIQKVQQGVVLPSKHERVLKTMLNKLEKDQNIIKSFKHFLMYIYEIKTDACSYAHWWGKGINYAKVFDFDIGPYSAIYTRMYLRDSYAHLTSVKAPNIDYIIRRESIDRDIYKIFTDLCFDEEVIDKFWCEVSSNSSWKAVTRKRKPTEYYYDKELTNLVKHKERFLYQALDKLNKSECCRADF
tara:strand:+ start:3585 stop:4364 length:780 start_codon:yes stop_codon:yes gene_type:complete